MAGFNTKHLKKQELLAKEDCELLIEALELLEDNSMTSKERIEFLRAKLQRMARS